MGRRTVVLAVAAVLALLAASGAALADNMQGNGAANRLVGTDGKDSISGGGGGDDIFGKGGQDRLFGDSGNDRVHGGAQGDRLQVGLGQDGLFGDDGNDFANAIDGQTNDFIDCGVGDSDIAGVDLESFGEGDFDRFVNCEVVYIGTFFGEIVPAGGEARGGQGTDLSAIDTREEAEEAEADGLLEQIK